MVFSLPFPVHYREMEEDGKKITNPLLLMKKTET